MRSLFSKPHLFISYSRTDAALSAYLYDSLTSAGFSVFYDKEKTLIGENFVTEILRQLGRSDAVVALISSRSAVSPWCQAELYHAHALRIMVTPVRLQTETIVQAPPLELFLKDINYVVATDESSYSEVARQIKERLRRVRRRRYIRSALNGLILLALTATLVLGWKFGMAGLNSIARNRQRENVIERLKASASILTRDVVKTYSQEFAEDEELIARLLTLQNNIELSDIARLNSQLLATALLSPRKVRDRWFIQDVQWNKSRYENGEFNNITFMKGSLDDIDFRRVTFAGVVWNEAPTQGRPGLMLSNIRFSGCSFDAGQFGKTGAVGVDFANCSFRGTTIDVSGFGAVHFFSSAVDENSAVVTNEVTVIENCSIQNCVLPAPRGVLEILPLDSEVRFTRVVFQGTHFRGLIRPSWFKDCSFTNCIFPESLAPLSLEKAGNIVHQCATIREDCY